MHLRLNVPIFEFFIHISFSPSGYLIVRLLPLNILLDKLRQDDKLIKVFLYSTRKLIKTSHLVQND